MSSFIRAALRESLLALRTEISERASVDESRVIITVVPPDKVPHRAADRDVVIQVQGEDRMENIDTAGGWVDDRRTRKLKVAVRTRLALDQAGEYTVHLTDESLGHTVFEDLVYDACHTFMAENDNQDALCLPMQMGNWTEPTPDADDDSWVSSYVTVSVEYERALSQERPR